MFEKTPPLIYIDGEISKKETISLTLPASGAFETILVKEGKIFRLEDHIKRLLASSKHLFKETQFDPLTIKKAAVDTLKNLPYKTVYLRVSIIKEEKKTPHLIIIAKPFILPPEELYIKGVRIKVVPTRRNPPETLTPAVKSQDFLSNIMAKVEASLWGAKEGIMDTGGGYLSEGGISNLFIIRDGTVKTPPIQYILRGIKRDTVIKLLKKEGSPLFEEPLTQYDLYVAEEAFLTYTSAGVVPVIEVDGRRVGKGKPGSFTKRILALYNEAFEKEALPIQAILSV
jgi:branched-chain amino acid aminotransferase